MSAIYLDYNATTPVDPRVIEKMLPYFSEHYGNPSSESHMYGWTTSAAIEKARRQVAECLGISCPSEITFTSGATESINTVLKGFAEANSHRGNHIVTVKTEHSAVLRVCQNLERKGWRITYLSVDENGLICLEDLMYSITSETILVCVMWANNETGVIQPMSRISSIVQERGIPLMTDATQAIGKVPISAEEIDILVCSAHKVYGPKGVGATVVKGHLRFPPLIEGGGQERGHRSGTHNVPAIVGMGEAFSLAHLECNHDAERLGGLQEHLECSLAELVDRIQIHGDQAKRLPQTSSLSFPGLSLERLLLSIRTLAVGTGSACGTGNYQPSHVLTAMGVEDDHAKQTLRISMGRPTTEEEVYKAIDLMIEAAEALHQKIFVLNGSS